MTERTAEGLCASDLQSQARLCGTMTDAPPLPAQRTIFVATRLEDVPASCQRYISVDGSVPGAVICWDHHLTGERINLDAMPEFISLENIDGIGTTLADADAVASVLVALFRGKGNLTPQILAILESTSHWCDHLTPHPAHDGETNRLGRGLRDYVAERLQEGSPSSVSEHFAALCWELHRAILVGEPLPFSDRNAAEQKKVAELLAEGRLSRFGALTVVDLRGKDSVDPTTVHAAHDCSVALFVESHADGGIRYTVGINPFVPEAPRSLKPILHLLAKAEFGHGAPACGPDPVPGQENWGGRDTVFGSPWNYGSRLSIQEVAVVINTWLQPATQSPTSSTTGTLALCLFGTVTRK